MIFNIDEDMVVNSVLGALQDAALNAPEDIFNDIVNKINETFPDVLQFIGQDISEYWQSEAVDAGGWGTKYAQAIKYKTGINEVEIYIDEKMTDKVSRKPLFMFAMMMEKGVKSWSIKNALLASEKVKEGKDGIKYITVPFAVRTPAKASAGNMASKFGGREMTSEMYKIVQSGGKLQSGTISVRGKELSIAGLSRYTNRQFHSQYGIFRRVSENSKGWQYPDIPAEPVYPKVLNHVNEQISKIISAYCQEIVKEYSVG